MNPTAADNVTSGRLLDPDEARRRLESRLGPLHARLRLGIEREHEAQAFGQGLNFLHLENLPLMQAMIEIGLRVTGTYWRGRANAGKVQLRRNTGSCSSVMIGVPNCSALDGARVHPRTHRPVTRERAHTACGARDALPDGVERALSGDAPLFSRTLADTSHSFQRGSSSAMVADQGPRRQLAPAVRPAGDIGGSSARLSACGAKARIASAVSGSSFASS